FVSEKSDHNQKHLAKKPHPLNGKKRAWHNKKQQTKTTKHTIEFSNNTPASQATLPAYYILLGWVNCVLRVSGTRWAVGM
ncbi:hypothetical protein, partial [Mycolicibacterium sp. F2034L]|uniref:hypothetical protein n=1 Tax=Mycolicibacterium sp. F2034L TaxID=2926422 RepID=UPI001FF237F4